MITVLSFPVASGNAVLGTVAALARDYPGLGNMLESLKLDGQGNPAGRSALLVANPPLALLTDWRYPQVQGYPYTLADYQAGLCAAIDTRTLQLRAGGFVWNGGIYAGDQQSQADWNTLALAAAGLAYPVTIYRTDGKSTGTLTSAADVASFHGAMVARGLSVVQAGAALKARVLAATTTEQLDAITDSRT